MKLHGATTTRWAIAASIIAIGSSTASPVALGCVDCRCSDGSLYIDVPDDRASDVASLTVSGPGCDGVRPDCNIQTGNDCTEFRFRPTAEGSCHIDVAFLSGASDVTFDLRIANFTGCCAGLYPADGTRTLTVPAR